MILCQKLNINTHRGICKNLWKIHNLKKEQLINRPILLRQSVGMVEIFTCLTYFQCKFSILNLFSTSIQFLFLFFILILYTNRKQEEKKYKKFRDVIRFISNWHFFNDWNSPIWEWQNFSSISRRILSNENCLLDINFNRIHAWVCDFFFRYFLINITKFIVSKIHPHLKIESMSFVRRSLFDELS